MTNSDSNAGDALQQWDLAQQQLTEFEDRLEQVLASYAFHQRALRAIIQEAHWETDPSHWQLETTALSFNFDSLSINDEFF